MFLVSRFVAGAQAVDAIELARKVNGQGMSALLNYLGEDVPSAGMARAAAEEYVRLLKRIAAEKVRAAITLKVSQMGILLSPDLCFEHLSRIAEEAARVGVFLWLDMERSALTRSTIEIFDALREKFQQVGLCLQASLVRTGGDFDQLAKTPFHVRLCKGTYKETPSIAYRTRNAIDGNFRMLTQKAFDHLHRGVSPAFATHDPAMLDLIGSLMKERHVAQEALEFQMLYGVENPRFASLAREGYKVSVYIPYGSQWLPYYLRRLRERKESIYFSLRKRIKNLTT